MISVCIPTYNQATYLEKAILSVIEQTLPPDEIVVSNDASTDNTKVVLDKLTTQISQLRVIHQVNNLGMSKNTDACLKAAEGDIIVKLDSDDFLYPDYIKELFLLLSKYPKAGYAHANVHEIDDDGEVTKVRSIYRTFEYQSPEDALRATLKGYRVAANIIMFKKEALQKVGYIQSYRNFAEDYFLSVAIADAGFGNVYCNKILSCYRVWADSGHVRQKRKLAEIEGLNYVFTYGICPAFSRREWDVKQVNKARENFACAQADCLSWQIYNETEKDEVELELLKLCSTKKVKFYLKIYRGGLGRPLSLIKRLTGFLKLSLKNLMKSLSNLNE